MGEIVNLRRFRKMRDRAEKAAQAAENRRVSGRSKADRNLTEMRKSVEASRLDGHRLTERGE